jgi:acetyl esterase/lipase
MLQTRYRVVLLIGALTLVARGIASNMVLAETAPAKDVPKQRPSQDAVLAKNTVLRADVPYGKDEKQRLDIYSPKGVKDAPIVVFVHGGEWTRGDKAAVSFKPQFLNANGIVFVSINYRLTPAVTHPAHVRDVAAALGWVREHAATFGGDPKKIVLMGHSAGCHLVTLVALDSRYLGEARLRPADLRGVVAWSGGAYDLVEKVQAGGSYASYIKRTFGESEHAQRDASPVAHVKDVKQRPVFLFVSVERGNPSHKAAERLAGMIHDAGGKSISKLLEGRDHFGANHLLGAPDDTTGTILLDFIREATR